MIGRCAGAATATLCISILLTGCASTEHIPRYPLLPLQQTLDRLHERSAAIHTVSGQGTLRLSREGQSVILDVALAIAPPDRAHVRAWKFGQAVFDLTVLPEGVYFQADRESSQRQQITSAGGNASRMIRGWLELMSGSLDAADAKEQGDELDVRQRQPDGTMLVCRVDRRTLTARTYELLDERGQVRFSIRLSRFIESNGQVWPTRLDADSPNGRMRLDLNEVEVNGGLPDGAFRPAPRAEKLP